MSVRFKRVGKNEYCHISQLEALAATKRDLLQAALNICPNARDSFNVLKFHQEEQDLTLLHYPGFFEEPFPILKEYWTVDLNAESFRYRTYADSLNPPVLHRKELMLSADHPKQKEYEQLTHHAEQLGLFNNPVRIGFQIPWEQKVRAAGYSLSGHFLVPLGNDISEDESTLAVDSTEVARHKTALTRYNFSAPIQALSRFGLLDGSLSIFDYGCGRGDDIRGLESNGIKVSGWDPHYLPEAERITADIVNLGFVINVIEDLEERAEALEKAFGLATRLLVVSAMLAGEDALPGKPFGDGVLTSRGTFQKYFTQGSLKEYIEETLKQQAIPVAPGVFYVFSDKEAEQAFQYGRQRSRRNLLRNVQRVRQHRPTANERRERLYEANKPLVDGLWESLLLAGRPLETDEVPDLIETTRVFGTVKKAIRFTQQIFESENDAFEKARLLRMDDLKVYLANQLFERRKPYKDLERTIQLDVKAFFGDYKEAQLQARNLLLELQSIENIYSACQQASNDGLGWIDEEDAFYIRSDTVERLPALLRAYINCGLVLYGDITNVDLVKVHVRSNKLSLMIYEGFETDLLPRLKRRTKLNLKTLDFDEYVYGGEFPSTYLYQKSRFMNEESRGYPEQIDFEEKLEALGFKFSGNDHGPSAEVFDRELASLRYDILGSQLRRTTSIPSLNDPCGRYLTFKDLIQCGETQARLGIANLPKEPDSYSALLDLAQNVLDPVIDYFGMIKLTYGFCSYELGKEIKSRIAPKIDQHAAHEKNRGKYVCHRLGAAVDLIVNDENMIEVAQWIYENTGFDRLYLYGPDRPIHVSFSTSNSRYVCAMLTPRAKFSLIPKSLEQPTDARKLFHKRHLPMRGQSPHP
jgi:DNA phosphorothioation-associated putative methyltransferase